jgi:putative peptidoglycan lipid II flippase
MLVGSGVALYGIACFLTGAYRIADFKALVRRRAANQD